MTLTKVGGGAFSLTGIDLAPLDSLTAGPVSFTGTKTDLSTVNQSFTTAPVRNLQSFTFDNSFTGLTSVSWVQVNPFHQFDNIRIDGGAPTAAPEASPLALLALGGFVGGIVSARRKIAVR